MDIEQIKKLREATGAGMMDAKAALEESKGDFDKAVEIMRQKGQAKAAKKAERETRAGLIESYTHMGRVGVLVEVNCETDFVVKTDDFKQLARDLAMHVAAASPQYLTPADVPTAVIDREKAVYSAEVEGKPAEIAAKIIEGKLDKFYAEVCLLKQPFIKDPEISIEQSIAAVIGKLGENITIRRFARLELGEVDG